RDSLLLHRQPHPLLVHARRRPLIRADRRNQGAAVPRACPSSLAASGPLVPSTRHIYQAPRLLCASPPGVCALLSVRRAMHGRDGGNTTAQAGLLSLARQHLLAPPG